jgi:hypothetical protein
MMEARDKYGEFGAGRVPKAHMCATVTMVEDRNGVLVPIACGYAAGHRSLHSWQSPPSNRGEDLTRAARTARLERATRLARGNEDNAR